MDFTNTVESAYYTVVVPVKHNSKMWYFVDPFSLDVWLLLVVIIPMYLVTMGLANHFFWGFADWGDQFAFVLRNIVREQCKLPNYKVIYQKVLILSWIWSIMVLVHSYSCNLTALLAKPKLQEPIKTFEDLLNQNKVSWVIEKGDFVEFDLATSASGSVKRSLFERATIMPHLSQGERMLYPCYAAKLRQSGRFGSFCNNGEIAALIAKDYSETGKCNYYITEDRIASYSVAVLAVQVNGNLSLRALRNSKI